MRQVSLTIFFLASLAYGFSQKGMDPFDLPTYSIKENKIKTISKVDSDDNVLQRARYDQHGNQTYHKEENRIIQFELDYNEKGHLTKQVAIGLRNELVLNKRPIYNDLGQIDSIYYVLPVGMYYSGFIEKYNYKNGRINTINVYSVPQGRLMFQHDYVYGIKNELAVINTIRLEGEDSISYFTKEFTYSERGGTLISSTQLSAKGDTIAINFFDEKGRLTEEISSDFYTTPSSSMYSSAVYSEALKELGTPLSVFIICKNLNRDNYTGVHLSRTKYQYENGKLLKSIKSVTHKNEEYILSTENYRYTDQQELSEHVTINPLNQDTTIVRFRSDENQQYIELSQNSKSYLTVKEEVNSENVLQELTIESFNHRWECKTTTDYDPIANMVTKKRYCLDSENQYPSEPEEVTVANFDSSGRQISEDTFSGAKKADKNTSYTYTDNGELIRYEYNGQYWKYYYNSSDSLLFRQEYYDDSLYENLESYFNYEYDSLGNYSITLIQAKENQFNEYSPTIQHFTNDGKIVKKEWISRNGSVNKTATFNYNEKGLCDETLFESWGGEEITRYEYEFY